MGKKCQNSGVFCIFYRFDDDIDHKVRLPYYGGAQGQILEIRQRKDGTIFSRILTNDAKEEIIKEEGIDLEKFQRASTTVKPEPTTTASSENSFEKNLLSIQRAAAELVTLQELFKTNGNLTKEEQSQYAASLEKLGVSAQKLAQIQQTTGDDFRLLFDGNL